MPSFRGRGRGGARGRSFFPKYKRGSRATSSSSAAPRKRPREMSESIVDESVAELSDAESEEENKRVRWEDAPSGNEQTGNPAVDEEADATANDKIVTAIFCQNYRVGAVYYDPVKMTLFLLEDTPESNHYDLTKLLLEQTNSDVVITSSRADEGSIDVMRDHMDQSAGVFEIRPHKDFIPAKGRDRILSLKLLVDLPVHNEAAPSTTSRSSSDPSSDDPPRNAYDFMRRRTDVTGDPTIKKWYASIRVGNYAAIEQSPLCASSVGALLDHLAKILAVGELEDQGVQGLGIRSIESLALQEVMQINGDALSSLQVFDDESHASIHSDRTKEGLSLYGILNSTRTKLGRNLLRQWLLRPSMSIHVINGRHDAVACFLRTDNIARADTIHNHLKGLKNVPRVLDLLKSGKATLADWQGLVKFTYHTALLRESIAELEYASEVPIVKKLIPVLDISSFREMGTMIHETIDWEESVNAGRVCVRPHVDEELDNWKHIYHGIDGVLSRVAEQICSIVPPDYTTSLNVVYFPQLGFLICVPMQEEWRGDEGVKVLDGWTFQFSSDTHVYFKSQEMHDMDHHIGDLHPAIVDREIEIIQALLEKILLHSKAISDACDVCAELDCLLCYSQAARAFDYRRPTMTEENIIDIRQGRHPLQEQVVDMFVPNDLFLRGGMGEGASSEFDGASDGIENDAEQDQVNRPGWSVMICTGANACGKSVYLKQAALIQYMAQIGCFVPVESATLGIVDKIFTRVQTRESVSKVQSAFMIDLNQVSLALRNATSRSLILLDEFGKGTLPQDGAGLFCGVLKHFLSLGTACPKILTATHFHDVFRDDLLDPALPIAFVHMKVLIVGENGIIGTTGEDLDMDDSQLGEDETTGYRVRKGETITYLYKVAPGLTLDSHAAHCARLFGLPAKIVQRARYVSHLLSTHSVHLLLDEDMTDREIEELQEAEAICKRFLSWDLENERERVERDGEGGVLGGKKDSKVRKRLQEVLGVVTEEE